MKIEINIDRYNINFLRDKKSIASVFVKDYFGAAKSKIFNRNKEQIGTSFFHPKLFGKSILEFTLLDKTYHIKSNGFFCQSTYFFIDHDKIEFHYHKKFCTSIFKNNVQIGLIKEAKNEVFGFTNALIYLDDDQEDNLLHFVAFYTVVIYSADFENDRQGSTNLGILYERRKRDINWKPKVN